MFSFTLMLDLAVSKDLKRLPSRQTVKVCIRERTAVPEGKFLINFIASGKDCSCPFS